MSGGWEGNRRSGVALAMRHRLQWFIHLRAHGPRNGDEHPAYTPHGVRHILPYFSDLGRPNSRVYFCAQENLGMILDLEKKIEGLIVFLSSDSQYISEGPVTQVDPRSQRIRLKPGQRNESHRHMFLVSRTHSGTRRS